MTINITFNGYCEMLNFCKQIVGVDQEKPKELTVGELNESAKATTEIINRAEKKIEAEEKKQAKKPTAKKKEQEKKPEKERKPRKARAVITDELRADIIKDYDAGYTIKEVAAMNNVSASAVFRTINQI